MRRRVLVATGTKQEAAALRGSGWTVIAGGGDATKLGARLDSVAANAAAVVSFGMAGALTNELAIGDWVVGERVTGAADLACDPDWSAAFADALGRARVGQVHADGRMIDTVAAKRALAAEGAIAVDMESHVVAAVASAHGLPFAIVRCISDTAEQVLPPAIRVAMRPDGSIASGAIIRSLAGRPGQVADLVRTVAGFSTAIRALRRGGTRLTSDVSLRQGVDR